jgi:Amt family ammonium transporter
MAAAAAALSWVLAEWAARGKPTMLGAASGAVAGLVAITPGSGFVGPLSAIVIGLIAGALCYSACMLKARMGYDDSLDVVGVHGVGGVFGAIATGIFASKAINPAGADGLIYGNFSLLGAQVIAVAATMVFAAIGTAAILFGLKAVTSLRVSPQEERMGLDLSQHSESAYTFTTDYDEPAPTWALSNHKSTAVPNPAFEEN